MTKLNKPIHTHMMNNMLFLLSLYAIAFFYDVDGALVLVFSLMSFVQWQSSKTAPKPAGQQHVQPTQEQPRANWIWTDSNKTLFLRLVMEAQANPVLNQTKLEFWQNIATLMMDTNEVGHRVCTVNSCRKKFSDLSEESQIG